MAIRIEDPLSLISPEQLERLGGLEPSAVSPTEVRWLGERNGAAWYHLGYEDGVAPRLLRLDRTLHERGAPVDHVQAAQQSLKMVAELENRRQWQRLPDRLFGAPAALRMQDGLRNGLTLLTADRRAWTTVAGDLGRVLACLADQPMPAFGTRASGGRFLPCRGSWRDEWWARVHMLDQSARRMGLDLGPLGEALVRGVQERLEALHDVPAFALVHGDLQARHLLYDTSTESPRLAGTEGWGTSLLGDPLVDVGFLLSAPVETLATVINSYGTERAEAWLEPGPLARIEAYHRTVCLARLASVADTLLQTRRLSVLDGLDPIVELCRQAARPDSVRQTIESALEQPAHLEPGPGRVPDPSRTVLRIAVGWPRGQPNVSPGQTPLACAAVGAALLAANDTVPDTIRLRCVNGAYAALRHIPRLGASGDREPVEDRGAWEHALVSAAVRSAEQAPAIHRCSALLATWLYLDGIDRLDGEVSDAVLRGVEGMIRAAIRDDHLQQGSAPPVKLLHVVLGLAATVGLGDRVPDLEPECRRLVSRLEDAAETLVEQLNPGSWPQPNQNFEDAVLFPLLNEDVDGEQALVRPVLVHALRTIHGRASLPTDAHALLPHLWPTSGRADEPDS